MKQKKKNSEPRLDLNQLIFRIESAIDALNKGNFNLAEVWVSEYYEILDPSFEDDAITKNIYNSLKQRNSELLFASLEAELERLRTEKVKKLRNEIIR